MDHIFLCCNYSQIEKKDYADIGVRLITMTAIFLQPFLFMFRSSKAMLQFLCGLSRIAGFSEVKLHAHVASVDSLFQTMSPTSPLNNVN